METRVEVLHDFPDVFSCSQVVWSDEFLGCSTEPFSRTAAISYFLNLAAGMPAKQFN
jgi:hypothetical protein